MRRYNMRLFRVARAILSEDAEAEDARQDAYLDAYRHMDSFRGCGLRARDVRGMAGDSVVWTNEDPFPHTVTSKSGRFDSGENDAGGSWTLVMKRRVEFEYLCTLHPTRRAG